MKTEHARNHNMSPFHAAQQAACLPLIQLALAEDLGEAGDLTSQALIPPEATATVRVVARDGGVIAGLPAARMVFAELDAAVQWENHVDDGAEVSADTVVAEVTGPLRSLLTGERTALNFLGHLSGVATLTHRFVNAAAGSAVRILDTRKTLPGWRVLEKYAVHCGGGTNHRMGLFDGVLIKDNHLAAWCEAAGMRSIAAAVRQARAQVPPGVPVEVEVDTLDQLRDALAGLPEMVLLDNMPPETLREAVAIRNATAPGVELEASGGITLQTIAAIAATGVDRISIGALTHSAPVFDIAFDWGGCGHRLT